MAEVEVGEVLEVVAGDEVGAGGEGIVREVDMGESVEVELGESGDFVVFEIQRVETVIFDLSEGSDFLDAVVGESHFLNFV